MNLENKKTMLKGMALATCAVFAMLATAPAFAQDYDYGNGNDPGYYAPPPSLTPSQLDNLVGRIALYPDPLLAQVLAAATFPDQIQDAAAWANQYSNLRGDDLANAIEQAQLPFDPSVQALLPFPSVLATMAGDMDWTSQLGNAVLAQRPDVMDAVQRMRRNAESYGYLRSGPQIRVMDDGGWVEVMPVDPGYLFVPVYDPYVVFAPPRPGFYVGGAIGFGPGFTLGFSFNNWGWGGGFDWRDHTVVVNHVAWGRTWANRRTYAPSFNRWDGGHWRPTTVNRTVIVNRNQNVNRDAGWNRNAGDNRQAEANRNPGFNRGFNSNQGGNRNQQPAPAPQNFQNPRNGDQNRARFNQPAPAPVPRYTPPPAEAPVQRPAFEQRPMERPGVVRGSTTPAPARNERPVAPPPQERGNQRTSAPSGHASGREGRR